MNTKLADALRAILPYALSRVQDMDENAGMSPAGIDAADKAAKAYEKAVAVLAEHDAASRTPASTDEVLAAIAKLKTYPEETPPDGDDAMRVLNYWINKARELQA